MPPPTPLNGSIFQADFLGKRLLLPAGDPPGVILLPLSRSTVRPIDRFAKGLDGRLLEVKLRVAPPVELPFLQYFGFVSPPWKPDALGYFLKDSPGSPLTTSHVSVSVKLWPLLRAFSVSYEIYLVGGVWLGSLAAFLGVEHYGLPALLSGLSRYCNFPTLAPGEVALESVRWETSDRTGFSREYVLKRDSGLKKLRIEAATTSGGIYIDVVDPREAESHLKHLPQDTFVSIRLSMKRNKIGPVPAFFSDLWGKVVSMDLRRV